MLKIHAIIMVMHMSFYKLPMKLLAIYKYTKALSNAIFYSHHYSK